MKLTTLLAATLLADAILFSGCQQSSPPASSPGTKWEYRVVEVPNDNAARSYEAAMHNQTDTEQYLDHSAGSFSEALNSTNKSDSDLPLAFSDNLAADGLAGWELVSAVPELETHDGFTRTEKLLLIYKRPAPRP